MLWCDVIIQFRSLQFVTSHSYAAVDFIRRALYMMYN